MFYRLDWTRPAALGLATLLASAAGTAIAADAPQTASRVPVAVAAPGSDEAIQNYWTADRLAHATELAPRLTQRLNPVHRAPMSNAARQVVHGGFPTADYDPALALDIPGSVGHATGAAPQGSRLIGSSGQPFTTNRLYPSGVTAPTHVYPYGTVGHLFFTEPGVGNFQCSASVIRAGVILTAGHCVADGKGHYYTNWVFYPAEDGTVKPFGGWTWSNAGTTSAWWSGGGAVPNEQDDALIILTTKKVNGVTHRVGDYTGWLGYEYDAGTPDMLTQLGYPCNLDGCADPVANYAQSSSGPTNTFLWGSAVQGGGSGGPIIQDFGQAPSGVPSETLGGNIVVSAFSFYYTASGFYEDGGSILYAPGQNGEYTFGDLINWACTGTTNC